MICAVCDEPTAHSLDLASKHPEGEEFCLVHVAKLVRVRTCSRTDCNRRLLLRHCAMTGTPRTVCAWCALGRPVSVDVVDGGETKLKSGANYIEFTCEEPDCDAKMCWRMGPEEGAPIRCKDHGGEA